MASNRHRQADEIIQFLRSRSIPEPNTGCTLWEGGVRNPKAKPNKQYGTIRLNGREQLVHRAMFEAVNGPLRAGQNVLHRCDMCLCINIDHLFIGTNDENHLDKARKDRGKKRLTHQQAMEIHRMRKSGMTHGALAKLFGVTQPTVTRVLSGVRRPFALRAVNQE